jgi:hypothetical protein
VTAWKARRQRDSNVRHNGDGRRNDNGRGAGGKEWGKLGRYHRGSGVAINLTLFLCAYYIVLLAPHIICDAQTKRRHVNPWCGDDVDALGLGAAMIWVMLGAISAPHHGRPIFSANGASTEPFFDYVDLYVGLVRFRMKKRKNSRYTSVYSVTLLSYGHSLHHFYFTHASPVCTVCVPTCPFALTF